ncbi:MAG: hypothetical protein V1821_00060 [bacterium]
MENVIVDGNELFNEIVERGRADGITEQVPYRDLCEEVLFEHEGAGEISDDSNIQLRVEALSSRFEEYLARLK